MPALAPQATQELIAKLQVMHPQLFWGTLPLGDYCQWAESDAPEMLICFRKNAQAEDMVDPFATILGSECAPSHWGISPEAGALISAHNKVFVSGSRLEIRPATDLRHGHPMGFSEVIAEYRKLLDGNPGKALIIGEGNVAVLEAGVVFGAALLSDGTPEVDNLYDFDRNAFICDEGRWDGETAEQLLARIHAPTFVDL